MFEFLIGTPLEFINFLSLPVLAGFTGGFIFLILLWIIRRRRRFKHSRIFCPYCLSTVLKADICSNCSEPLHKLYQASSHAGQLPELISIVGFSGHGKTVYLASLLYSLTFQVPLGWKGYFRRSLDQNAIDHLRRNMDILRNGDLPDSTRLNFPKPSIQQLNKMPRYQSKVIALYDPPGEAFEAEERLEKFASFISRSRATLFLVSLEDLQPPYGAEIQRLLEVYTLGLSKLNGNAKQQHLIVVFTKADAIVDTLFESHPDVIDYLHNDDPSQISDLPAYLARMKAISTQLRESLQNGLSAAGFVNFAEEEFKTVSYTVVSALGSPPDVDEEEGAKLSVEVEPRRVLDPLLWILERT